MAVLDLQLPGLPENLNVSATPARAPDSDAATTSVNSNVAQGAPAPLDTITLAGQAASGQGSGQETDQSQQGRQQQSNDLSFVPNFIANLPSNHAATANDGSGVSQPASQRTNAAAGLSANNQVVPEISTSGTGSQQGLEESQKQQLQQLDQTLRQLGIDPQSIGVFNQLALLSFANNPAGLKQFLTQFQQAAQQILDQSSSNAASHDISSAAAFAASKLGSPTTTSADSLVAAAAAQSTSASQNVANANSSASEVSIHFQELQFAVAAVGGQLQMSATGTATLHAEGESLNVTF